MIMITEKGKIAPNPYEGYIAYGPTWHWKQKRYMISLYPIDKEGSLKRTSTSHARYLMAIHLGRKLSSKEQVDHIDGDKTNDTIENLQILSQVNNMKKSRKERKVTRMEVELLCLCCGVHFKREKRQTHLAKKTSRITSCSRKCAGTLSHKTISEAQVKTNVIRETPVPAKNSQ